MLLLRLSFVLKVFVTLAAVPPVVLFITSIVPVRGVVIFEDGAVAAFKANGTLRAQKVVAGRSARNEAHLLYLEVFPATRTIHVHASWLDQIATLIDPAFEAILIFDEFATLGAAQHELLLLLELFFFLR